MGCGHPLDVRRGACVVGRMARCNAGTCSRRWARWHSPHCPLPAHGARPPPRRCRRMRRASTLRKLCTSPATPDFSGGSRRATTSSRCAPPCCHGATPRRGRADYRLRGDASRPKLHQSDAAPRRRTTPARRFRQRHRRAQHHPLARPFRRHAQRWRRHAPRRTRPALRVRLRGARSIGAVLVPPASARNDRRDRRIAACSA